jgi:hypothetical protein
MQRTILISTSILLGLGAVEVFASVTTFSDETAFLAAAGTCKMESFEGLTPGAPADSFTLTDFTVTALLPIHSPALEVYPGPYLGAYATDGTQWIGYQSDLNEKLQMNFSSPIHSFGINITDWGDYAPGNLIFSNNAGDSFTVATGPLANGNYLFCGIVNTDTAFTSVELLNQPTLTFFGVDEVYYTIPEPSCTTAIVSGILLWLFLALRRRTST